MVISVEDYNNFLREQTDIADAEAKYAALMDDLQELIEQQKQTWGGRGKIEGAACKSECRAGARGVDAPAGQPARPAKRIEPEAQPAGRAHGAFRPGQTALRRGERICRSCCKRRRITSGKARRPTTPTPETSRNAVLPPKARVIVAGHVDRFQAASDDQVARLGGVQEQTEKQIVRDLAGHEPDAGAAKGFQRVRGALPARSRNSPPKRRLTIVPGELSREDQLALKELAATRKASGR